jgi:hypothetical protein
LAILRRTQSFVLTSSGGASRITTTDVTDAGSVAQRPA